MGHRDSMSRTGPLKALPGRRNAHPDAIVAPQLAAAVQRPTAKRAHIPGNAAAISTIAASGPPMDIRLTPPT